MVALSRAVKVFACVLLHVLVAAAIITFLVLRFVDDGNDSSKSSPGTRVRDSLKFVVVVSRHGNRGSVGNYPGDPYPLGNTTYWPYGFMELTPRGRVQSYKLGVKVRSLYDGLVNSTWHPENLYASSTVCPRVLISGEMFLAGLYPPRDSQLWYSEIDWEPVPVYTSSPDNSVSAKTACPAYEAASTVGFQQFVDNYTANITAVIDYMNNATGANVSGTDQLYILWDKLISEETEGYTDVPSWTHDLYPELLRGLIIREYVQKFIDTDEMVRLLMGNFFAEVIELMERKINKTLTQTMYYYSGHDTSILGLHIILGLKRSSLVDMIKPGSAMIFELHENTTTNEHSVQVLYIDGASADLEPSQMLIPNCEEPCNFYTLVNNTRNFTDVNFTQECQVPDPSPYTKLYHKLDS